MRDEEFFVVECALAGCFVFAAELVCTGFFGVAVDDASWVDASLLAMANPCMERQSRLQRPTRCQCRIRVSQPMDRLQPFAGSRGGGALPRRDGAEPRHHTTHHTTHTKIRREQPTLSSPIRGGYASLAGAVYRLRKCSRQENRSILRP